MTFPSFTPGMTFDDAARAVLQHLREHVPMALWAVTRMENGRQSYLFLDDESYGLEKGGSHPWEDGLCIRMATGQAPPVAPDAQSVPAYASAAVNQAARIGSYAGAVIAEPDGRLFGALCGLDPQVKTDDPRLLASGPLLGLLGQLLTMVLAADRAREAAAVQALDAQLAADTDVLTGLSSRRAWDRVLVEEEQRFDRFGDPTALAVIDLDRLKAVNDAEGHAAGDLYLRRCAVALAKAVRATDVVARLGGDEFGVLLRGCEQAQAQDRVAEIHSALTAAGVAGSIGWAPITMLRGFPAAFAAADEAMYAAKRARRTQRLAH